MDRSVILLLLACRQVQLGIFIARLLLLQCRGKRNFADINLTAYQLVLAAGLFLESAACQ